MESLSCTGCGAYVLAVRRAGAVEPVDDACPECGATSFEDVVPDET